MLRSFKQIQICDLLSYFLHPMLSVTAWIASHHRTGLQRLARHVIQRIVWRRHLFHPCLLKIEKNMRITLVFSVQLLNFQAEAIKQPRQWDWKQWRSKIRWCVGAWRSNTFHTNQNCRKDINGKNQVSNRKGIFEKREKQPEWIDKIALHHILIKCSWKATKLNKGRLLLDGFW